MMKSTLPVRQPGLSLLLLLTALFLGLAIYDANRTLPAARDVIPLQPRPVAPDAPEDGLTLFMAAINAMNTPALEARPPAYHPEHPTMRRSNLDEAARDAKALALIQEGVKAAHFDHALRLWPEIMRYTDRNLFANYYWNAPYIMRALGTLRRGAYRMDEFPLHRIGGFLAHHMREAVARRDSAAFVAHFELSMQVTACLWADTISPEMQLENLGIAVEALRALEHAVNCLSLDASELARLRQAIEQALFHKTGHIGRAYMNRYAYGIKVLQLAQELADIPVPVADVFDRTFASIADTWLSREPLQRLHYLYYLRQIITLSQWQQYGGESSFLWVEKRLSAADYLREYALGGQGWGILTGRTVAARLAGADGRYQGVHPMRTISAFSKETRQLADGSEALWPYMRDYEPYVWLLASARAADTALAALQYHLEQGRLPETVEVLSPYYLRAPHTDPYAYNKTLEYRCVGEKAQIFGVKPPYENRSRRKAIVYFMLYDPILRLEQDLCDRERMDSTTPDDTAGDAQRLSVRQSSREWRPL